METSVTLLVWFGDGGFFLHLSILGMLFYQ